jgi:hypothetical protein
MLGIVFASKTYDLDQTSDITGIESSMYAIAKTGDLSSLASKIQAQKTSSAAYLADFVSKVLEKNP